MKTYSRLYSFGSLFSITGLFLGLLFLLSFGVVSAHETGSSLEATEGLYKLDVGYSGELTVGTPVVFDFNILKKETNTEEGFDSVWVRLGDERGVSLSTRLHGSATDKTILNYRFLESGEYSMLVRFSNSSGVVAEHTFVFSVEKGETENYQPSHLVLLSILISFLVGVFLTRLFF